MFTTRFTATLAATLCLAAATPAFAGSFESNGRQMEVRYGDLNLASAAGKAALNKRISAAATRVCTTRNLNELQACRALAIQNVKAPIAAAVAQAETNARYADARGTNVMVGN